MQENTRRKKKSFAFRWTSFMMVVIILLSFTGQVEAGASLDIKAPAAILIDTDSGQILYGKNIDSQRAMASTSKLMTYLLTMDAVEEGRISLTDQIKVSKNAEYAGGSSYRLKENDILTVDELLNSLMIISANDSAVVLAEHLAGSVWNFSEQMNLKAKELGLASAHFINPNGMPVSGKQNMISARDLGELSRHTINKHGDHLLNITNKKYFTGVYKKYSQKNTNDLLETTSYVDGLKTGYTHLARFCLVSTARLEESENNRLVSVVMGSRTRAERARDSRLLLDYGRNQFKSQTILTKGEVLKYMALGSENNLPVEILAGENLSMLVKKDGSNSNWKELIFDEADLTGEIVETGGLLGNLKFSDNFELPIGLSARRGISIQVDGRNLLFEGAHPFIENDTTLVPLRVITEQLGARVKWIGAERAVVGEKDGMDFKLIIDEKVATINGKVKELRQAPIIVEGTTMLPVRFLAEELGLDVNWDKDNRRVEIRSLEELALE